MAFKHRKLFLDPIVINITAFCEPYCDPIGKNDENRLCPPLICKKSCPYTCTNPFPSLIPPLHPPPPPPPTTTTNHHKKILQNAHLYLVISLSILAALCFAFSTYSIYKYYKNRNRAPPSPPPPQDDETRDEFIDEEHGPVLDHPIWYIRTIGLQQSAINAITICKYKRGDGLVEGTECSVCLNEFQEDETLRLLPKCNHAFHLPCIDTWLRSHTNCPMCRAGIVADPAALPARQARPEPETENSETLAAVTENRDEEETEERGFEGEEDETTTPTSEEDLVGETQPMRRSVSLDCVSASMISTAIANANSGDSSNTQLEKSNDLMMKRSVSCSGNVLMKISNARNQN